MIRIIALTEPGRLLAEKLVGLLPDSDIWFKPSPFAQEVQSAFKRGERLLFICATGIVVRCLAPVLRDKHQDPPVLVMDEKGEFVIPLLSGHEGGANDWGREVAQAVGAQLVVTSAESYMKPVYSVGMGCERGCSERDLHSLLLSCLEQAGLVLDDISCISSIDIKADETGLISLASSLDKPFKTWTAEHLRTVEDQLSTHSDYIFATVGVYGVAESAALYASSQVTGRHSELVLNKQKNPKATCAIARSYQQ